MTTIRSDANAGIIIDSDTSGSLTFVTGDSNVALQIDSTGKIDFSQTKIIVPIGNTASRVSQVGAIRFNNESNVFEAYNGASWNNLSKIPVVVSEYLVVAGGGGGGGQGGGGGGAGGMLTGTSQELFTNKTYSIRIGGGGAGGPGNLQQGTPGTPSYILDAPSVPLSTLNITSVGGGGGGAWPNVPTGDGLTGGSGGGSGKDRTGVPVAAGTPGQGNPGGVAVTGSAAGGSGGGGRGSAGVNGSAPEIGGAGGNGANSAITGANVTYAGGGGGGVNSSTTSSEGAAGPGGGGRGGRNNQVNTAGTTNRGGGGGGAALSTYTSGLAGGSGIIVIAYPNTYPTLKIIDEGLTYSLSTASRPGYYVYTFTAGIGTIGWE